MKFMSLNPLDHEVNGEFMHFRGSVEILPDVPRPFRVLANTFTASYINMELIVNLSTCKGFMLRFILCWTKFKSFTMFSTAGFVGSINRTVVMFVRKFCTIPLKSTVCASCKKNFLKIYLPLVMVVLNI